MATIGIDPGMTGAIVVLGDSGLLELREPMPILNKEIDVRVFRKLLHVHRMTTPFSVARDYIFLEKAQAFPGQGSVSMFTYGKNYGMLLSILRLVKGFSITEVPAVTWTKKMFSGKKVKLSKKEKKERSMAKALDLFGEELFEGLTKAQSIGMADAALIAYYGYLTIKGSEK